MSAFLPLCLIGSQVSGVRILIVAAADADIGLARKFNSVETDHQLLPDLLQLRLLGHATTPQLPCLAGLPSLARGEQSGSTLTENDADAIASWSIQGLFSDQEPQP